MSAFETRCEFNNKSQRGVSLVELVIVITLLVVISTVAIMQFGSSKKQFSRQNVAQELKVAFERARFDSVKRRAVTQATEQAYVTVNQNSYTLVTDVNQNGSLADAVDSKTTDFSGQGIGINSTLTLPYTVYFNKRGEAVSSSGSSISPSFLVCNPACTITNGTSNATNSNANLVLVTPTGTVNLLPGGSSIPSFAAPAVTPVPGNSQIRKDVIMNSSI